jgi:hypothetical protein
MSDCAPPPTRHPSPFPATEAHRFDLGRALAVLRPDPLRYGIFEFERTANPYGRPTAEQLHAAFPHSLA